MDGDVLVAFAGQVVGDGEAGGTGADDGDLLVELLDPLQIALGEDPDFRIILELGKLRRDERLLGLDDAIPGDPLGAKVGANLIKSGVDNGDGGSRFGLCQRRVHPFQAAAHDQYFFIFHLLTPSVG